MFRTRTRIVALLVAAGAASALAATAPPAAAATRPVVALHVTSAKTVSAPRTTRPGRVHLHNTGAHSVYLYRLRHGNLDTFVRDTNSSSPNGLLRDFFAVDHLQGRSELYASLPRGTYYLVDGDVFPIKKAWVATLTVRGSTINAPAPAHAYSVAVSAHDALSSPASMSPKHPVRLRVSGTHAQVVWLFHVGSSVSNATVAAFVAHPSPSKYASLHPLSRIELAAPDAPQAIWTTWRAGKGRYVIFNLAYDKAGRLTFAHGQARRLTVT